MLFTLPNFLTCFRLFVSPIYLLVYSSSSSPFGALLLLTLLVFAEGSDLLDGFLARRWNQVSNFGKIFDPFADSLYRVGVLMILTLPPVSLPLYLILIFLYRDSLISTLRTMVALKGVALQARWSGKLKGVLQGAAIFIVTSLLYLHRIDLLSFETLQATSFYLTTGVAIYTLFSGLEYLLAVRKT